MGNDPSPEAAWGQSQRSSGWVAPTLRYRPLDGPARMVQVLLGVFTLVTLVAAAGELAGVSGLLHEPSGLLQTPAGAFDGRQTQLAWLQLGAYLLTAVGFVVWFHRGYANLPALGVEPLPFAPVWAVGAWLVPLLNLLRPKQIMDAIWRGSDPERPRYDAFWRQGPVPALVRLWWAVFVVSWLVDRVSLALLYDGSQTVPARRVGGVGLLAGQILDLVLALLCFQLLRRATRRQQARAARLGVVPSRLVLRLHLSLRGWWRPPVRRPRPPARHAARRA
jgi:Domain of unknown function (DUF4328)